MEKLQKWIDKRGLKQQWWNEATDYEKLPYYLEYIKDKQYFPYNVKHISIPLDINHLIVYLKTIITEIENKF